MKTAYRIFKNMPLETRKAILNQVINTQGMKGERPKWVKDCDADRYGTPRKGDQNFLPLLFETSVKQHL